MKVADLIPVVIQNPTYGEFNGIFIYVTPALKSRLEKIPSSRNGTVFNGLARGFSGGKYLLQYVQKKYGKERKIALIDKGDQPYQDTTNINYEDYRKHLRKYFLPLYRERGLAGALEFLKNAFPNDFADIVIPQTPTEKQVDAVVTNLPKIATTKKRRNNILEQVSELLRTPGMNPRKITPETIKELQAASNQAFYRQKVNEFEIRLQGKYSETKGARSWQSWIYKNTWMFGVHYLTPIEKHKVGFDSIPDFLFPTLEGFVDILEIKLPTAEVISKDDNHRGSYYWSTEISKSIGQVVNYISEMELHSLELKQKIEREYNLKTNVIKPRAIVLVGKSDHWSVGENEAYRRLNHSLHGIEVVTYDQLRARAHKLIELYETKRPQSTVRHVF